MLFEQQLLELPKNPFSKKSSIIFLPVVKTIKTIDTSQYDIYPCHQIPLGHIDIGHKILNEKLFNLIEENHLLLIDGFVGTYFNEYAQQFNRYYWEKKEQEKFIAITFL